MNSTHSKSFKLVKELLSDLDYTRKSLENYLDIENGKFLSSSIFACKIKFMRDLCEELHQLAKEEIFEYEAQMHHVSFTEKARTTKSDETGLKLDTRTLKSCLFREETSKKKSKNLKIYTEVTDSSGVSYVENQSRGKKYTKNIGKFMF